MRMRDTAPRLRSKCSRTVIWCLRQGSECVRAGMVVVRWFEGPKIDAIAESHVSKIAKRGAPGTRVFVLVVDGVAPASCRHVLPRQNSGRDVGRKAGETPAPPARAK